LRQALALWRGPALADVAYHEFAQPEVRRLEELHSTAREARVEADLRLGRHQKLVPELESLVGEDPTRERLTEQLMLALYRCGRQTDALDVLRRARAHLVGELGLEPGPALLELQAKILNRDPALELPRAATAAERAELAVVGAGRRRAARVPQPHGGWSVAARTCARWKTCCAGRELIW
jgi:DNA-binding SARP family transcriptional activator